ncbi:MAG: C69 family dipeptidase, partial [Bacteroidales bacterium]|nr:C69 family dipeptidase [Bacteroidales bacterium]
MLRKFLSILLILTLGYQYSANACTIIAVGKKASADGSNIISHTDTGPDSRIFVVPAQTFKPGEKTAVYWGIQDADRALNDDGIILGYIPQVEKTFKYFQSAYSHVNEYQLGIGESTTAQRNELTCTRENGKQIMTIEQAQIFALQRYKNAREAVQFIGDLM